MKHKHGLSGIAHEIVLRDERGDEVAVPVTYGATAKREIGGDGYIADCVLGGTVAHGVPLSVEILFRTDGSWAHWVTRFDQGENHYLHVRQSQRGPATESQRRAVARWWLRIDQSPYGMAVGSTVLQWAFPGESADEISRKYGDGATVYLTAPCDDREEIIPPDGARETTREPVDRTGFHKGDVDGF